MSEHYILSAARALIARKLLWERRANLSPLDFGRRTCVH